MSFSVLLNSKNGVKESFFTSEVLFNFDWSNTPKNNGKYKVYMSFTTIIAVTLVTGAYDIFTVTSDFGGTQDSFSPKNPTSNPGPNGTNNRILGIITAMPIGDINSATSQYLGCDYTSNPPVIFQSKPSNNNFTIRILQLLNGRGLPIQNTDYLLNLYFEAVP